MYVCICQGVTDKQIKNEVLSGSTTIRAVCQQLGVAGQCGKCGVSAKEIIQSTLSEIDRNKLG